MKFGNANWINGRSGVAGRYAFLLIFLLCSAFALYFLGVCFYSFRSDPWSHGDWLINYSSGLTRRGLFGEFVLFINSVFGLHPRFVVPILQSLLFGLLLLLAYKAFLNRFNLVSLIFVLWPSSILMFLIDPALAGRKEVAFFVAVLIWIFIVLPSESISHRLKPLIGILLFGTLLLIHEGFTFFLLPLALAGYSFGTNFSRIFGWLYSAVPFISAIPATLVSVFGSKTSAVTQCVRLIELGYPDKVCEGAIRAIDSSIQDGLLIGHAAAMNSSYLSTYPLALVLTTAMLLYIALNRLRLPLIFVLKIIGGGLVGLFTLSLIADDWGRWINILTVLSLLIFIAAGKNQLDAMGPPTKLEILVLLIAFVTLGFSSAEGRFMSIVSNLINVSYYLSGGLGY